jgi:hypothetical protein
MSSLFFFSLGKVRERRKVAAAKTSNTNNKKKKKEKKKCMTKNVRVRGSKGETGGGKEKEANEGGESVCLFPSLLFLLSRFFPLSSSIITHPILR